MYILVILNYLQSFHKIDLILQIILFQDFLICIFHPKNRKRKEINDIVCLKFSIYHHVNSKDNFFLVHYYLILFQILAKKKKKIYDFSFWSRKIINKKI